MEIKKNCHNFMIEVKIDDELEIKYDIYCDITEYNRF